MTNPTTESKQFTYASGGLMTSMTDARGSTYRYTYDSLGYLTKDADPVGGYTVLARTEDSTGYTISSTTAMGKVTKYRVDKLHDGSKRFTNTDANGLKTVTSDASDGTASTSTPDGTTVPTQQKPDPRFGMQSPLGNLTKTTPAGLTTNVNQFRTVTQMTGNAVTGVRDSVLLNGKIYKTDWDGNLRRLTKTSPEGRKTFSFYDSKAKIIKDSTAGIVATAYKYDSRGRRSEANQGGRKTTFSAKADQPLAESTIHSEGNRG